MTYITRKLNNCFEIKIPINYELAENFDDHINVAPVQINGIIINVLPTEAERQQIMDVRRRHEGEVAANAMIQMFVDLFTNIYPDTWLELTSMKGRLTKTYIDFVATQPVEKKPDTYWEWKSTEQKACLDILLTSFFRYLRVASELIPELENELSLLCGPYTVTHSDESNVQHCDPLALIELYDKWQNTDNRTPKKTLENIFKCLNVTAKK